jgi:hypothetical protein
LLLKIDIARDDQEINAAQEPLSKRFWSAIHFLMEDEALFIRQQSTSESQADQT